MKKYLFILLSLVFLAATCGEKDNGNDTPTVPGVPEGIKLHSATETSLAFQWTPTEGATSYDWRLLQGATEVTTGTSTARNALITELTPGTAYRFSARSVNAAGSSAWSAFVEAATLGSENPDPDPDPDTPVDPTVYEQFLIPASEEDGRARAFPGAEGGGMWATGGRGGKILHVNSLEDTTKEGTLRWAVTQNYPRIIVFDVAGIIELKSTLNINRNDVTIAGQTAPGDGICLKNYRVAINASNVVIRHIRCRMGDEKQTEDDAMNIMSHENGQFKDIIIDHCSLSWSTDECASFYGMDNFTLQWCIISESLRNSIHGKGSHGYGGIWGGTNATYLHNLLAHHDSRNPRIDHDYVSTQKGPVSLVNNVVYNWGSNTCYGGESANNQGLFKQYNLICNYYKPGPATSSKKIWFIDPTTSCSNCSALGTGPIVPGHFYMTGNFMEGNASMSYDNWKGTTASSGTIATIRSETPFTYAPETAYMTLLGAGDAFDAVLGCAGAVGASGNRDTVDERVTAETRNGTYSCKGSNGSSGGLIDSQTDAGGWPEYKGEASNDSDADGMPDWFEDQFGLAKFNPSDASAKSLDMHKRYTNIEMYLHYLVRHIVSGGNGKGTYTII
ncbi:MAG: fibronectin type III domain-containing protein [Bacteroidales bacterium]|nr:fibronectin type III domain-containing protein [Bacteroidales bacterium]